MRDSSEPLCQRTIVEHADDRSCETVHVSRVDEEAVRIVLHEVGDSTDAGSDHTAAATEGLDDDAAHALRSRWKDETGRLVERGRDFRLGQARRPPRLLGHVPHEGLDDARQSAPADDVKPSGADPRGRTAPGSREAIDVLVALEHPDEERLRPYRKRRWRA